MADATRGAIEGTLFVVSTPIGNLEDVTFRAIRILREADLIAAEDTRVTKVLLARYDIERPLVSVHEHNEAAKVESLLADLRAGKKIALVTDAGTPVLSDPGFRLVRAAREAGAHVEVIPGPSAITAAVAGAGLPAEGFAFVGFPPRRGAERERWARRALALPTAVVFFESPHRVVDTLADLAAIAPAREAAVCRELTKMHEEFVRAPLASLAREMAERDRVRGEVTVVIASPGGAGLATTRPDREGTVRLQMTEDDERTLPTGEDDEDEPPDTISGVGAGALESTEERTIDLDAEAARLRATGLKDKEIAKELARLTGRPARDHYAELVKKKP